jgi:hypothetical protein
MSEDWVSKLDPEFRQTVLDMLQDVERKIQAGQVERAYRDLMDIRPDPFPRGSERNFPHAEAVNALVQEMLDKYPELVKLGQFQVTKRVWNAAMMAVCEAQNEVWAAKRRLEEAKEQFRKVEDGLFQVLEDLGWRKFELRSKYLGDRVHPELGDVWEEYWFPPDIDFTRWVGVEFTHGRGAQDKEHIAFECWLDQWDEGDDYFVRRLKP